jgi:hypothetical protein
VKLLYFSVLFIFFLMEIAALLAAAYWGFHTRNGWIMKSVLGIGSPFLIAMVWGRFIAPKAPKNVSPYLRVFLQLVIFGFAAGALFLSGVPVLAYLFFSIVIVTTVIIKLLEPRSTFY